jgi:hypothetical protein
VTPAPADRLPERVLWQLVCRLDRGGAAVAARRLAAAWMRRAARTDAGYEKGRLRVARRTPVPTPRLVKLPESWSSTRPLVRTRRGGLVWEEARPPRQPAHAVLHRRYVRGGPGRPRTGSARPRRARLRPRLLVIEVKAVVIPRGPGDEERLRELTAAAGYAATGEVHEHNAAFRRRAER